MSRPSTHVIISKQITAYAFMDGRGKTCVHLNGDRIQRRRLQIDLCHSGRHQGFKRPVLLKCERLRTAPETGLTLRSGVSRVSKGVVSASPEFTSFETGKSPPQDEDVSLELIRFNGDRIQWRRLQIDLCHSGRHQDFKRPVLLKCERLRTAPETGLTLRSGVSRVSKGVVSASPEFTSFETGKSPPQDEDVSLELLRFNGDRIQWRRLQIDLCHSGRHQDFKRPVLLKCERLRTAPETGLTLRSGVSRVSKGVVSASPEFTSFETGKSPPQDEDVSLELLRFNGDRIQRRRLQIDLCHSGRHQGFKRPVLLKCERLRTAPETGLTLRSGVSRVSKGVVSASPEFTSFETGKSPPQDEDVSLELLRFNGDRIQRRRLMRVDGARTGERCNEQALHDAHQCEVVIRCPQRRGG